MDSEKPETIASQVGTIPIERGSSLDPTQSPESVDGVDGNGRTDHTQFTQTNAYTLIELHAEGGLGKVSLARDESLRRNVAIKEIRADRLQPETRRRFLREAEITSRLEHPGVVPVYSLDTNHEGHPYYAMRFIQGRTLEEGIVDYHNSCDAVEFRNLLGRFVSVCNTIAYAHNQGVIHRDLKPSNVMLGEFGETLVVDWGLAKSLDEGDDPAHSESDGSEAIADSKAIEPTETLPYLASNGTAESSTTNRQTEAGQVLGTPSYMSPEQAAGDLSRIDKHSDIFSLGAVLYKLLTNQVPFRAESAAKTIQQVMAGTFVPAHDVRKDTPRPLSAVCAKALSSNPADRYRSATELADDVNRWLADESVQAYTEPWTQRMRRWTKRRRTLVVSLAGIAVTGLVGLTIALSLVTGQQRETQAALDREAKRTESLRNALTLMSSSFVDDWLMRQERIEPKHRQFLKQVLKQYKSLVADEAYGDAKAELANAYLNIGHIQARLGDPAGAEAAYRNSIATIEQLKRDGFVDPQTEFQLAHANWRLGQLFASNGKRVDAAIYFNRAYRSYSELARRYPDNYSYRFAEISSLSSIGRLEYLDRFYNSANRMLMDVDDSLQELLRSEPENERYRHKLIFNSIYLALSQRRLRQFRQAELTYRHALKIADDSLRDNPDDSNTLSSAATLHNDLGVMYKLSGRSKSEILPQYQKASTIRRRLANRFPSEVEFAVQAAGSQLNLGNLYLGYNQIKAAISEYDSAIDSLEEILKKSPNLTRARMWLRNTFEGRAEAKMRQGRFNDALKDWDAAIKNHDARYGITSVYFAARLPMRRAYALARLGRIDQALTAADKTLRDAHRKTRNEASYLAAAVYCAASTHSGPDADFYTTRSLELLEQAMDLRWMKNSVTAVEIFNDPDFDPLRAQGEFQRIEAQWREIREVQKQQNRLEKKKPLAKSAVSNK